MDTPQPVVAIAPTPSQNPTRSETDLLIAFTRLEGKVDVALVQHGAELAAHTGELKDHEDRIRRLELTPTVGPKALWTAVASAAALLLAAGPVLTRIFGAG